MERTLVVLSVFLFLVGCSTEPPAHWEYAEAPGAASKIYFPTEDNFKGIDLELVRTSSGDRMYASVHSQAVTASDPDDREVEMTLTSDTETMCFKAYRFLGGQRFLLPQEAIDSILSKLQQKQTIKLHVGRYEQTITAEEFEDAKGKQQG